MKQNEDHDGQWFIFKGEQHRGPYKTDEMVNLFALGVIGHRDLVWREGGGSWLPFADHTIFRDLIFKEGSEEQEVERPPIEVPLPSLDEASVEEAAPPELPPVPDEVEVALDQSVKIEPTEPIQIESEMKRAEVPDLPQVSEDIEKTSPSLAFEEAIIEDDEATSAMAWGKIVAGVAFVLALTLSALWFLQFHLQTYELIGLERADVEQFNHVILDHKADHIVHVTTDGNVIWAASPGVIEGDAYLHLESIPGRALSTDPLRISAQGNLIQGLVPFKRFEFAQGEQWVQGEYRYQLDIRPKGAVARLASLLAPYPWFKNWDWVKIQARGHSYSGKLTRYDSSARKFENDLASFKEKIWKSMSQPLQIRLEKYQTLKKLAVSTKELWYQRLGVAVTWRAFKKYDEGYGRDIAPVLQELVVDSVKIAAAAKEESPLVSRVFEEIEETGKQLGELASQMSAASRAVKKYRQSDKQRLTQKFEEMWQPLMTKINARLASLESQYAKLQATYNPKQ